MSKEDIAERRVAIVNGMCMTWRHDFGLMDQKSREGLHSSMDQIFEHDFLPHFERMRQEIADLEAKLQVRSDIPPG